LGRFPLFHFWGPRTSIQSSQWIADAALMTDQQFNPNLSLIYLPHLDYNLQRLGTDPDKIDRDLQEIDNVVGQLLDYYEATDANIILLSEYGITDVERPVHLNRVLRESGLLAVREERGLELLDAGASEAFAVADHQVAHIYVREMGRIDEVMRLLENVEGVDKILRGESRKIAGLDHARSGDLIAIADAKSWFTYYFWEDDAKAPDFARMVDIHKKPGYDPVELFTDPEDSWISLRVMGKLIGKKLGFRTVMNVIPLNAELVKGSHGRVPEDWQDHPVFISNRPELIPKSTCKAAEVYELLCNHVAKTINHEKTN
jgi:predicted AlkP superfamily pyrophosphatase or phosphodiesterase